MNHDRVESMNVQAATANDSYGSSPVCRYTMCHGFRDRDRSTDSEKQLDEEELEESDPSFFNDEPAEDVEILTDGGDE